MLDQLPGLAACVIASADTREAAASHVQVQGKLAGSTS